VVPYNIIGDHNADQRPDKTECHAQPFPQHRAYDGQEYPGVPQHQIVEANAEARPNYAHYVANHCNNHGHSIDWMAKTLLTYNTRFDHIHVDPFDTVKKQIREEPLSIRVCVAIVLSGAGFNARVALMLYLHLLKVKDSEIRAF